MTAGDEPVSEGAQVPDLERIRRFLADEIEDWDPPRYLENECGMVYALKGVDILALLDYAERLSSALDTAREYILELEGTSRSTKASTDAR
jgi:hypothetical protein